MLKYLREGLIIIFALQLFGCASTKLVGTGTVVNQMQLKKIDYVPQHSTDVGAVAGGTAGVVGGTAVGLALTVATFGLAAPLVPAFAVAGGVTGGTAGAATGYAHDIIKQGHGLYDYVVEMDTTHEKIVVRQYADTVMPNNTRVKVVKEEGVLKVKSLNN